MCWKNLKLVGAIHREREKVIVCGECKSHMVVSYFREHVKRRHGWGRYPMCERCRKLVKACDGCGLRAKRDSIDHVEFLESKKIRHLCGVCRSELDVLGEGITVFFPLKLDSLLERVKF